MGFWDAVALVGHVHTICTSLLTDNDTNTSLFDFLQAIKQSYVCTIV